MGINSMEDVFENEWAIINLLTQDWLRILEEPKKKGHEHKQKNHPVWDKIRSVFRLYFPGGNDDAKAVWKTPAPVAGDAVALKRQALGCLSKALGVENGEQSDEGESMQRAVDWIFDNRNELHYKMTVIARHTEYKSGIPLGVIPLDHNMEHMHTLDQDFIDRKRAEANTWTASPSSDNTNDSVELKGSTCGERWHEYMGIMEGILWVDNESTRRQP